MAAPAVPAGYAVERERGATIVALPSVIEAVRASVASAGSLYAAAAVAHGGKFTGRGAAYRVSQPDGDWVVRHYRRGGMVARVLGDEYVRLGTPRPITELRANAAARARGVDTPEVVAAITYPAGLFYRADLATRFVPGSRDLASVVLGSSKGDSADRVAAWRAAGALLHRAFDAGVEHVDLNMRNILIAKDRALLLDLDRTVVRNEPVSGAARHRMIERFHRSRRKLESMSRSKIPADELAAFEERLRDG